MLIRKSQRGRNDVSRNNNIPLKPPRIHVVYGAGGAPTITFLYPNK